MPRKPNSHNSALNAYRVLSAFRNYPSGLINSQVGIILTYYSGGRINGKPINDMLNRQITAFSKRLYQQADKIWKSLTSGEKEIIKVLAERSQEGIQDLEEKVAILFDQNEIPDDSPVIPDIKRILG